MSRAKKPLPRAGPAAVLVCRAAVSCLMDEHNTIMVTWANFHYQDFVMNWVDHVRGVGVTAYLVGAMDDKLLEVNPVYVLSLISASTVTSAHARHEAIARYRNDNHQ